MIFPPKWKACKQQQREASRGSRQHSKERKNPGGREGWEWKPSRRCNRELAQGHDAVPEEQMRSSYLRRREGGEVALPMPCAACGYRGETVRNSPALSAAPRRHVLPGLTRHTAGWR